MSQKDFCQDCHQKHDCQQVYRQMGYSECPPVFWKTVVAFLMPMVVFTFSLAIFERILSGENFTHFSQRLQTAICFFVALIVTIVFMIVYKLLSKLFKKIS